MTTRAVVAPAEQRVVLEPVSWDIYTALCDGVETRRGRMAYDRGMLEIMSPSKRHENTRDLLGRLVEAATEVLGIEIESAGSLTLRREDLERGGSAAAALVAVRDVALSVDEVLEAVRHPQCGGVALFVGLVRDHDHGESVTSLEYSAHPSAQETMASPACMIAARG